MAVDYASIAVEVAAAFAEVRQGTLVLQHTTYAEPDPATPWIPGEAGTPVMFKIFAG